jgi:hypothetical protein
VQQDATIQDILLQFLLWPKEDSSPDSPDPALNPKSCQLRPMHTLTPFTIHLNIIVLTTHGFPFSSDLTTCLLRTFLRSAVLARPSSFMLDRRAQTASSALSAQFTCYFLLATRFRLRCTVEFQVPTSMVTRSSSTFRVEE